jgi:hypothetical protein
MSVSSVVGIHKSNRVSTVTSPVKNLNKEEEGMKEESETSE